jgi:signal transduction histidine kinase
VTSCAPRQPRRPDQVRTDPDGHLEFTVADDGVGFDAVTTTTGTGLQGMADRLAAAGGSVYVRSVPGTGTTIHGRLPV